MGAKHVEAVVTSRRDVSSDLWIVRVRPAERIDFTPGQYATVGLPGHEGPYSILSSPRQRRVATPGGARNRIKCSSLFRNRNRIAPPEKRNSGTALSQ